MRPGTNVGPTRIRGGNCPAEVCGRPSSRQARLTQRPISCTGESAVQTTKSAPAATDLTSSTLRTRRASGTKSISGFSARSISAATSTLRRPMSHIRYSTCRFRLLSSIVSSSTATMRPTPAHASPAMVHDPSPPAPSTNTVASRSASCMLAALEPVDVWSPK